MCHVLEPTFQLTANESWSVLTSKEVALTSAGGEKQGWTPRGQCGTVGIVSGIPKDVRFPRWALTVRARVCEKEVPSGNCAVD